MLSSAAAAFFAALAAFPGHTSAEVKVFVYGQSGKFKVYDDELGNQGSAPGPLVTMDGLTEVDADGNAVCQTGPKDDKHTVNFPTQDFTIDPVVPDVSLGEAKANMVRFYTDIGNNIGSLQVDTYVVSESGTAGNGEEEWTFNVGDMKWNIVFNSWNFCTAVPGAFLDFDISVSGLENPVIADDNSYVTFGNTTLVLAKKVLLDGELAEMPEGYPTISIQGQRVDITFRFPKFNTNATYDPGFVDGLDVADASTSDTGGDGETTTGETTTGGTSTTGAQPANSAHKAGAFAWACLAAMLAFMAR